MREIKAAAGAQEATDVEESGIYVTLCSSGNHRQQQEELVEGECLPASKARTSEGKNNWQKV